MRELARRYAQAYWDLSPEEAPLRAVAEALTGAPELWRALTSPAIRPQEKKRVLDRLLGEDACPVAVKHLFFLLCDKGRMDLLPELLEACHALALEGQNAAAGVMTCVHPPDPEQKRRLEALLCRRHHRSAVHLDIQIDPSLLGGFTLAVDGVTYDKSVRGQLRALSRQLEEGNSL